MKTNAILRAVYISLASLAGVGVAAHGDFRLQATSPCVNTGTNQPAWMTFARDMEGNPRIDWSGLVVDRGCYELTPPRPQGTCVIVQ